MECFNIKNIVTLKCLTNCLLISGTDHFILVLFIDNLFTK